MTNNLAVNPYIRLFASNNSDVDFELTAPLPQRGLQTLNISKTEQPNLHEVFLDLSTARFDLLDIEIDIDEKERELLFRHGILIERENMPQKPLFACYLDEAGSRDFEIDESALVVDPTFRFELFEFASPKTWMLEKCFVSGTSSIWVKQPVTEIEIGYWLTNEQTDVVSNFTAGEKLPYPVTRELLSKLISAGILSSPELLAEEARRQREVLEKAKNDFQCNKYVVLREILPASQMSALRRYYRQYVANGFMPFQDVQSRRFYEHSEPLASLLHKNLAHLMSFVTGEEILPSYVYAASYIENSDLTPHTDREQCEFSISFQVDYLPETKNHLSPWGLFLQQPDFGGGGAIRYGTKEFPAQSEAEDENTAVYMASGDGLIYKGRELIHYRYPLAEGHQSTSLFFHYVSKTFDGRLN